jgi:uncharacterized protein with ACT and thioredoxin-like domain
MNRIVKAAQPLVLVAVLFVAGALFGGQVVRGQLELAKKPSQPMYVPVDGGPKPPGHCC